jgi:hypothetical protein
MMTITTTICRFDGGPREPRLLETGSGHAPEPHRRVTERQHPHETIALILELMWVRSLVRVGLGMLQTYPTEAEWTQAIGDAAFLDMCDPIAAQMDRARTLVQFGPLMGPEAVQAAYADMFAEAMEAVVPLAEHLGVNREDVLSVLIQTEGRYAARTEVPPPPEDDPGAGGAGTDAGDPGRPGSA